MWASLEYCSTWWRMKRFSTITMFVVFVQLSVNRYKKFQPNRTPVNHLKHKSQLNFYNTPDISGTLIVSPSSLLLLLFPCHPARLVFLSRILCYCLITISIRVLRNMNFCNPLTKYSSQLEYRETVLYCQVKWTINTLKIIFVEYRCAHLHEIAVFLWNKAIPETTNKSWSHMNWL